MVSNTIAIPRLPQKIAKKIAKILKIGRYRISVNNIHNIIKILLNKIFEVKGRR